MTMIVMTPPSVPALSVRLSRLVGKAPWGVADQMLISASNMVVIVLLAWGLTQDAMGGYVLVSQLLLIFNSLQDGLVTQPHNVVGPTLTGDAYRDYSLSTAVMHFALAGVFVLLILVAWAIAGALSWWPAPLLLALAPATLAWQTQELARRIHYTEGRADAAFLNDVVGYGGQAALVGAMWWYDILTGPRALYAIAIASGLAAVIGLWRLRDTFRGFFSMREAMKNWRIGKWLASGELVGVWLGDGTLCYIAAGVLGKEAAAIIRAVHTIFGPSRVLAMVLHTMLPIHLARRLTKGGEIKLRTQVRTMMIVVVPAFGAFCLIMAVFAHPILDLAFGHEYARAASFMRVYALAMLLCYIGMVLNAALKAQQATRPLFINRLVASLITLATGTSLLYSLGLPAAALGMSAGHLSLSLLNAWWLSRHAGPDAPATVKVQEAVGVQEAVA